LIKSIMISVRATDSIHIHQHDPTENFVNIFISSKQYSSYLFASTSSFLATSRQVIYSSSDESDVEVYSNALILP